MESSTYVELVERLKKRFASGVWVPVDVKSTGELCAEIKESAEAIGDLLSLIGELADAAETGVDYLASEFFPHRSRKEISRLAATISLRTVLQKAREATGGAVNPPATTDAEN